MAIPRIARTGVMSDIGQAAGIGDGREVAKQVNWVNRQLYRRLPGSLRRERGAAWACCTAGDLRILLRLATLVNSEPLRRPAGALASKTSRGSVLRACMQFMLSMLKFHATGFDPCVFALLGRAQRGARDEYMALLVALASLPEARAACGLVLHID